MDKQEYFERIIAKNIPDLDWLPTPEPYNLTDRQGMILAGIEAQLRALTHQDRKLISLVYFNHFTLTQAAHSLKLTYKQCYRAEKVARFKFLAVLEWAARQ